MSAVVSKGVPPEQKLFDLIEKVVIRKGKVESDPKIWEFHISGKVLKIDAEKVEKFSVFKTQFIKVFDKPAPGIPAKAWGVVLEALDDYDKKEYLEAEEDSDNVFIAERIFEMICKLPVTEDKEMASLGRGLYKYKDHYCLTSEKLEETVKAAGFPISWNKLSETMTELGLKKPGTDNVRFGKKHPKCWLFKISKVDDVKGTEDKEE